MAAAAARNAMNRKKSINNTDRPKIHSSSREPSEKSNSDRRFSNPALIPTIKETSREYLED